MLIAGWGGVQPQTRALLSSWLGAFIYRLFTDHLLRALVCIDMANTSRLGTITALLTMSVLIPASWDSLGADGPEGNQEARPALSTLDLGDAKVTISVDRPIVDVGERVRVALAAESTGGGDVAVTVALQAQDNMRMSRMPSPPITVESERVTLAGNGTSKEISFLLKGSAFEGMDPMQMAGGLTQYTILVTKAGPAEEKKKAAKLEVWNGLAGVEGAAMVQVAARQPAAYDVAMSFAGTDADGNVSGKVVIRNTSKKTLKGFNVNLTSYPSFMLNAGDFKAVQWTVKWDEGGNGQVAELAAGADKVITFTAKTQNGADEGTLYANVWASYGGQGSSSASLSEAVAAVPTLPAEPVVTAPVIAAVPGEPELNAPSEPIGMQFAAAPPPIAAD